jgi:hypothetical protein
MLRIDLGDGAPRRLEVAASASYYTVGRPVGVSRSGDGSIFVAVTSTDSAPRSSLYRFAGSVVGRIFGDGFD